MDFPSTFFMKGGVLFSSVFIVAYSSHSLDSLNNSNLLNRKMTGPPITEIFHYLTMAKIFCLSVSAQSNYAELFKQVVGVALYASKVLWVFHSKIPRVKHTTVSVTIEIK